MPEIVHLGEYVPVGDLSPMASTAVVFVVGVLAHGAFAIFTRTLARRSRYRAWVTEQSAIDPSRPLAVGYATLTGDVESEGEGEVVAMRVQQGLAGSDAGGRRIWSEVRRTVEARPFYLALASGERVRVEPGTRVVAVDDLGDATYTGPWARTRSTLVKAGQRVTVAGILRRGFNPRARDGGYRHAEDGFVVTPPDDGPLVVSSTPLADRHLARAAVHAAFARWGIVAFLLVHTVAFGGWELLALTGRTETADLVHVRSAGGRPRIAYTIPARPARGRAPVVRAESTTRDVASQLDRATSGTVPVLVTPFGTAQVNPGRVPRTPTWSAVVASVGLALLVLMHLRKARQATPWYERRRIVETEAP